MTNAWHLIKSSRALWSLDRWESDLRQLRHLDTSCHLDGSVGGARSGRVLWGSDRGAGGAAIAWDWREVRCGVLAIADPMSIQSNIELLDVDGRRLQDSHRIVLLNWLVYQLPWQQRLLAPRPRSGGPLRGAPPGQRAPARHTRVGEFPVRTRRGRKTSAHGEH